MKVDTIDYETDLSENVSREVFSQYLKKTDAKIKALHPDYSYFVSSIDNTYTILESIDSDGGTIYNLARLEEGEIEEERISWEEVKQLTED